jgi:hypothetical protein
MAVERAKIPDIEQAIASEDPEDDAGWESADDDDEDEDDADVGSGGASLWLFEVRLRR